MSSRKTTGTKRRYVRSARKKTKQTMIANFDLDTAHQSNVDVHGWVGLDAGPGAGNPYTLTGLRWTVSAMLHSSVTDSTLTNTNWKSFYWNIDWAIVKLEKGQNAPQTAANWPALTDMYDPDKNMICWGTTSLNDYIGELGYGVNNQKYFEWTDHTKTMRTMEAGESLIMIAVLRREKAVFTSDALIGGDPPGKLPITGYPAIISLRVVLQSFRIATH